MTYLPAALRKAQPAGI